MIMLHKGLFLFHFNKSNPCVVNATTFEDLADNTRTEYSGTFLWFGAITSDLGKASAEEDDDEIVIKLIALLNSAFQAALFTPSLRVALHFPRHLHCAAVLLQRNT